MKNIIKNPPPEYEEDIELNKKVNKRLEVSMCVSQKRKHMWPQTYEEIFSTWIMREMQMTTQQETVFHSLQWQNLGGVTDSNVVEFGSTDSLPRTR